MQGDADRLWGAAADGRRAQPRNSGRRARPERRSARPTGARRDHLMAHQLPLADVKVLDFTWVMHGPATTRMLADFGPTIVRIEAPARIDTPRTLQQLHHATPGPDTPGLCCNCHAGK